MAPKPPSHPLHYNHHYQTAHLHQSSSSSHQHPILADVSRPSLSRLTSDLDKQVAEAHASHRNSPNGEEGGWSWDAKGKKKAVEDSRMEVIIHQVKPKDSLMGVALMYGIELATLRKANKLWASDPIHIRTELYIPLEACLRGNVIRGPSQGQATILPRGHYRSPAQAATATPTPTPPLIRFDSVEAISAQVADLDLAGIGIQVPIQRAPPANIKGKPNPPRKSADHLSLNPLDRSQLVRKSPSLNQMNLTALNGLAPEPRISLSSSRASLDRSWSSQPPSRTSMEAESEASIELKPRLTRKKEPPAGEVKSLAQQRVPSALWFSVADDGMDPREGYY